MVLVVFELVICVCWVLVVVVWYSMLFECFILGFGDFTWLCVGCYGLWGGLVDLVWLCLGGLFLCEVFVLVVSYYCLIRFDCGFGLGCGCISCLRVPLCLLIVCC